MGAVFSNMDMAIICAAASVFGVLYLIEQNRGWRLLYACIMAAVLGAMLYVWLLGE